MLRRLPRARRRGTSGTWSAAGAAAASSDIITIPGRGVRVDLHAHATPRPRAHGSARCEHMFVSGEATILHADLDAFYASVEQRDDPRLRGRPVIVGGGVVLAASYEAKARRRPHGDGRSAGPAPLPRGHRGRRPGCRPTPRPARPCSRCSSDTTPLVEGLSIDEAFLDVRGLRRIAGTPTRDRRRGCAATSASGSACPSRSGWPGRSSWPRWPAAWPSPTGCWWCRPAASWPSSTRSRSSGCGASGPATAGKLRDRGITTVGEVAALGEAALVAIARSRRPAATCTRWPTTAIPGRSGGGRRRRSIGSQRALGRSPTSPEALDAVARRPGRPRHPPAAGRRARRPHGGAPAALRRLLPGDPLAHAARGRPPTRRRSWPPRGGCSRRPRR